MLALAAARPSRMALYLASMVSFATSSVGAELVPTWVPTALDAVTADAELYYEGQAGRIVGVDEADLSVLAVEGAVPIGLEPQETLYVFWLEDAARAEFDPPARVLNRRGREVVVATLGGVPRLTDAADDDLAGLVQPVRVTLTPIPGSAAEPIEIPTPTGTADPAVQQMLIELTNANFLSTWQTLEDFVTRYTFAPENDLATQWILDEFSSFGLAAEFHMYTQNGLRRNVIATLPGVTDPSKIVYITSHLDAVTADPYTCAPGADDNGSGTAGVIEAARVLSQYDFDYTLKFACFNGEEQGLVGSKAYVQDIAGAGEDVIAAFNMDMIAYRGNDPAPPDLFIYTNGQSQAVAAALEGAIDTYLPGVIDPVVLNEAMGASDHRAFWDYGYPAILAIEAEVWGSDFCPWYHTCQDLVAQYSQEYVVDCARGILAATAEAAGLANAIAVPDAALPAVQLFAARPTPSGPVTVFSFALPAAGPAELIIYGVSGRRVRTLADGAFDAGPHSLVWDARNDRGVDVAPGVYFYRLTTPDAVRARRLVVMY